MKTKFTETTIKKLICQNKLKMLHLLCPLLAENVFLLLVWTLRLLLIYCLEAMCISVPVLNSVDNHTWCPVAYFCQDLWVTVFTMSWLFYKTHQLKAAEGKSMLYLSQKILCLQRILFLPPHETTWMTNSFSKCW